MINHVFSFRWEERKCTNQAAMLICSFAIHMWSLRRGPNIFLNKFVPFYEKDRLWTMFSNSGVLVTFMGLAYTANSIQ